MTNTDAPPANKRNLIIAHVLLAVLVVLFPPLLVRDPWSVLSVREQKWELCAFALAYFCGVLVVAFRKSRRRIVPFEAVGIIAMFLLPVVAAIALLSQLTPPAPAWELPGRVLAAAIIVPIAATFFLQAQRTQRFGTIALTVAALITIAVLSVKYIKAARPEKEVFNPQRVQRYLDTSLYQTLLTSYRYWIPTPRSTGGGLSRWGRRNLLATGDGDLYLFDEKSGRKGLDLQKLSLHVPLNLDEISADVDASIQLIYFRVADILVQESGGRTRLYASHHFWKRDQKCFVMRISTIEAPTAVFEQNDAAELKWQTLFETSPCLRPKVAEGSYTGFMEAGGRLAFFGDHQLLLSVGDHSFDGTDQPVALAQDPSASYGKILLIDLKDGHAENFSLGHRNPQGLLVAADGSVWSTEHGPQGGDELNLIQRGRNYGWPNVTLGTSYGLHTFPSHAKLGTHEGYEQPVYAWVPSVGASNLIQLSGDLFSLWKGDFLVASLRAKSLYLLRLDRNHVQVVMPIPIGSRVRDTIEDARGRIVMWTDRDLIYLEPALEAMSGEQKFAVCGQCHSVDQDGEAWLGPNLRGVVGRRVASDESFHYSDGLRKIGGEWSREKLDKFLQNPSAMAPGTPMTYAVGNDADRHAIVEFLANAHD